MKSVSKIKTVIVDDEPLARRRIKKLISAQPDIELFAECNNGKDALTVIENAHPDLVFLDVQMPEWNGFDVIERMDIQSLPVIIFVTAYDTYAIKAFDVHAIDYILKPFDDERFFHALDRAREFIRHKETGEWAKRIYNMITGIHPERPPESVEVSRYLDRIVVKSSGRIHFVPVETVDWIEASGKYLDIHSGKATHRIRESISELEHKLDPGKFLRIHRSYIINIDCIREMQSWHKGEYVVILNNDVKLITGKGYRSNLNVLLNRSL
ncbi:LytTR family DNA-binding domain-containing protein [bacterium]|nr:LytTR family DNA-binding domain-containing protein [bacterium]